MEACWEEHAAVRAVPRFFMALAVALTIRTIFPSHWLHRRHLSVLFSPPRGLFLALLALLTYYTLASPLFSRLHPALDLLVLTCLAAVGASTISSVIVPRLLPASSLTRLPAGASVVVLGGGIAGSSAAWALAAGGYRVTLAEPRTALGGNAKTHTWASGVTTGLSVLAWPPAYFRNYGALLSTLGVMTEHVNLPFFVHRASTASSGESHEHLESQRQYEQSQSESESERYDTTATSRHRQPPHEENADALADVVAHGRDSSLRVAYAVDYARWSRMVAVVRRVGYMLSGGGPPSLYALSLLNPFNLLSLRFVCRCFRITPAFWRDVVVPVYSSSFLTTQLDGVPAVIAPVLDDLIPLNRTPRMETWTHDSADVFTRLAQPLHAVRLGFSPAAVIDQEAETRVKAKQHCENTPSTDLSSSDRNGEGDDDDNEGSHRPRFLVLDANGGAPIAADAVVFACPSKAVRRLLPRRGHALTRALLGLVGYVDDDNTAFLRGHIHTDASVIPAAFRSEVLAGYANYIEIGAKKADGLPRYENTFVLSSWVPAAQRAVPVAADRPPMLVTYDLAPHKTLRGVRGEVDNSLAHPHLSVVNLAVAFVLRLVQGGASGRIAFCGSYTTPGNGHDLSLLSGLCAAHALGAPYPFEDNSAARHDFNSLRRIMGI